MNKMIFICGEVLFDAGSVMLVFGSDQEALIRAVAGMVIGIGLMLVGTGSEYLFQKK